jgi:hypothetical protein
VIEHLLGSTTILAMAMAAARLLPLTARTRYALLLCGVAKFAVPTAVFRFVPATAVPAPLRILGGAAAGGAAPSSSYINWISIVWATIALLLFGRWLLLRTRTIAAALREPAAVSARELAAVRDGRATMRIDGAVDAIRSPICERMEHLMSYETIKRKAWPHRAMLALGIVTIALSTLTATATSTAASQAQAEKRYSGEPISLDLKDADLRDVLKTFGQLTGLTIDDQANVTAPVTIHVVNVPWDKVLDDVLSEHDLVAEIDGKTIHVTKKKE